jgi:pyruvate formate lyase activating enzyme
MSTEEILSEVVKDMTFYKNSGGGLTLSGGDPLFRPEGSLEILRSAKEMGIHTCIETSGYAKWEDIEAIAKYVDVFLWDVKETDSERHKRYTGVSDRLIIENLEKLDSLGARVVLRCPIIPEYNDREEHFSSIGSLADRLGSVERVEIEPYHPMGISKCADLGIECPITDMSFPDDERVELWLDLVRKNTSKEVRRA